jgi:Ca2+-binding RTX toxin-like protein
LPGGIYVNQNAAARVGLTSDALFLSFRGTNDNSANPSLAVLLAEILTNTGPPDVNQWNEKLAHYNLFAGLIAAIDAYLAAHPALNVSSGLFASPGYGFGIDEDARITNIWLDGDTINLGAYLNHNSGDDNSIFHILNPALVDLHGSNLYVLFTEFLDHNGIQNAQLNALGGFDYDRVMPSPIPQAPRSRSAPRMTPCSAVPATRSCSAAVPIYSTAARAATTSGGTDNDRYVINGSDTVVEGLNAGNDTVFSSVTYVLAGNVEALILTGASAINGTGNALANGLYGNGANNALSGLAGNDVLNGSGGIDRLAGGAGFDRFDFRSALNSTNNRDIILDYSVAQDTIRLDHAIFAAFATEPVNTMLTASAFWSSASGIAHDGNDRVVYKTATGVLTYDSNDSAAGGTVAQFAVLAPHLALTNADFMII